MYPEQKDASLATLKEIRTIMERSARLLSLSGWSGIWAGIMALAGAAVAHYWLHATDMAVIRDRTYEPLSSDAPSYPYVGKLVALALCVFVLALAGGYYFTYRKNKKLGLKIWNSASRKMLVSLMIPMAAGGILVLAFIFNGHWIYVAPACLVFYGMALFNGSRYTISDIRYLGLLEIMLGCAGLLAPGWEWSLYLWAFGFGVLHILYGIIMWRKYDQQ